MEHYVTLKGESRIVSVYTFRVNKVINVLKDVLK